MDLGVILIILGVESESITLGHTIILLISLRNVLQPTRNHRVIVFLGCPVDHYALECLQWSDMVLLPLLSEFEGSHLLSGQIFLVG